MRKLFRPSNWAVWGVRSTGQSAADVSLGEGEEGDCDSGLGTKNKDKTQGRKDQGEIEHTRNIGRSGRQLGVWYLGLAFMLYTHYLIC